MARVLSTDEGEDQYLLAGLALGAAERGLAPGPDEVYAFSLPPVLGGPMDVEHVQLLDFVVAHRIFGQIHEQIKDLPPGSPISSITIE